VDDGCTVGADQGSLSKLGKVWIAFPLTLSGARGSASDIDFMI
jgi:hypothetical protein